MRLYEHPVSWAAVEQDKNGLWIAIPLDRIGPFFSSLSPCVLEKFAKALIMVDSLFDNSLIDNYLLVLHKLFHNSILHTHTHFADAAAILILPSGQPTMNIEIIVHKGIY